MENAMTRALILGASALALSAGAASAQAGYVTPDYSPEPTPMQCQLIRWAVAQYGFAAARQHALETYGPEAVATGDKCFTKEERDTGSYAPTRNGAAALPQQAPAR
jgi:hypothetical protein